MPDSVDQKPKKAAKKLGKVESTNILGAIKAELAQEYLAKEIELKEEHAKEVAVLRDQLSAIDNHKHNLAKLEARVKEVIQEREAAEMRLKEHTADAAKYKDLAEREIKLIEERTKFIAEREEKINDIVNTRTQRMKDKLDEDNKVKLQAMGGEFIRLQEVHASKLYNDIATIMRDSKLSVFIMMYVVEMLKQSLIVEERRRIGIDTKTSAPTPPVPPTESNQS